MVRLLDTSLDSSSLLRILALNLIYPALRVRRLAFSISLSRLTEQIDRVLTLTCPLLMHILHVDGAS